jgi:hypothetical protein
LYLKNIEGPLSKSTVLDLNDLKVEKLFVMYGTYRVDVLSPVQMLTWICSAVIQESIETGISDGEALHMFHILQIRTCQVSRFLINCFFNALRM